MASRQVTRPRTHAEIQAEIDRLEALLPTLKRQYQSNAVYTRMSALQWALGLEDA